MALFFPSLLDQAIMRLPFISLKWGMILPASFPSGECNLACLVHRGVVGIQAFPQYTCGNPALLQPRFRGKATPLFRQCRFSCSPVVFTCQSEAGSQPGYFPAALLHSGYEGDAAYKMSTLRSVFSHAYKALSLELWVCQGDGCLEQLCPKLHCLGCYVFWTMFQYCLGLKGLELKFLPNLKTTSQMLSTAVSQRASSLPPFPQMMLEARILTAMGSLLYMERRCSIEERLGPCVSGCGLRTSGVPRTFLGVPGHSPFPHCISK